MSGAVPGNSQKEVAHQSGLEVVSPEYIAPEVVHPVAYPVSNPVASPPKQERPYNAGAGETTQATTQAGLICGLRRTTFWLSTCLVLVIIAAAVGGGVGGSIAVQNARNAKQSQSSAGASSVTTSLTALPAPTAAIQLDCPAIDGTTANITAEGTSYPFKVDCSRDISGDNIISLVAYYFTDCMRACVGFNGEPTSQAASVSCQAVEFNTNLTFELQYNFGNCWLKSSSNTTSSNSNYPDNSYALAILQGSASGSGVGAGTG